MTSDKMIELAKEFLVLKCNGDPRKLKIPQLGQYIRSKGYDVQDYLLRRNTELTSFINGAKQQQIDHQVRTVTVFQDLDVDAFIAKNSRPDQLKKALMDRQSYYLEVAHSAAIVFDENRAIKADLSDKNE